MISKQLYSDFEAVLGKNRKTPKDCDHFLLDRKTQKFLFHEKYCILRKPEIFICNLYNEISRADLEWRKIFIPTVNRIEKSIVVEHINKWTYKWSRWLIEFEIFREQSPVIFVPSKWSTRKIDLENFKYYIV